MKILVDERPKEPKECLFSEKTLSENYVCKFQGSCMVCKDTKKCEFLKRIGNYQFDQQRRMSMTKCDFCTKSDGNGKCFWCLQSARESDCEKAIKRMIEALKATDNKKTFQIGELA